MQDLLARLGLDPSRGPLSGVYAGRWIPSPGGEVVASANPTTGRTLG